MEKRVFLIVLDSFGIGAEPDAAAFGDEGTNTLGAIANHPNFNNPNTGSETGDINTGCINHNSTGIFGSCSTGSGNI